MKVIPRNYALTFEPDLEKFSFNGNEILTFEVKEKTKEIFLDAVDLKIINCELFIGSKNVVDSFRLSKSAEKLIINLSKELIPGHYQLNCTFEGLLNDKLTGFYRSRYSVNGKVKYLATTQFEAADARRTFPCIDNPLYKATFDVSLTVDKNLTAISNSLPKKTIDLDRSAKPELTWQVNNGVWQGDKQSKKRIVFERTPLMSTYLLYMGIGEFEFLEDEYVSKYHRVGGMGLRVATTPGKKQYGQFALECAKKSLEYFEKYFNFPYPLKKLDLIAVTEFASGAMENWGAITFRENALLFYPEKSSKSTRQRIAEVVAHEIAHQWFGNLVTMKWWDDLWLNESFATYMANKMLDHYWPEWDIWAQYVTDTVFEGMALDSLKSSHPIKVKVKQISEIDELFDEIAYEKGGSILRMLDLYIGEEVFRTGLAKYINKFKYKNAEAQDLWGILENESKKKVLEIMYSYLLQTGFPKVTVNEKHNVLTFTQQRFLYEGKDSKTLWKIPLVLKNGKDIIRNIYLPEKELILRLNPEEELSTVNYNYSGFLISDYSEEILLALGKKINLLTDQDKIGLIHDLFALVRSEDKDLKLIYQYAESYFKEERSSLVLHYLISKFTGIYLLIRDDRAKNIATDFSKKALLFLGYEPGKQEKVLDVYLRAVALSALTLFDNREAQRFSNKKFINYLQNENSLHSDLRSVVFSAAVWFDERNYEVIKKDYENTQIQEEKAKLLSALGFSKSSEQIKSTLKYLMSEKVPLAFLPYGVGSISRNPYAKEIVLDWLFQIWPDLIKMSAGLATMLLRRILQSIIPVCAIGREKETTDFLLKNRIPDLKKSTEQVLEEMRINSRFFKKYKS